MAHQGIYIALDGPEGSGKGLCMGSLKGVPHLFGRRLVLTHEPGGTPLAEIIRNAALCPQAKGSGPLTQLLLHSAAREESFMNVVAPALREGALVISDRTHITTLTHQIYGQMGGFDWHPSKKDKLLELYKEITAFIYRDGGRSDAHIFFKVEPSVGCARKSGGDGSFNHFDERGEDFHRRVHQGLLDYSKRLDEVKGSPPYVWIDGNKTKEEVLTDFKKALEDLVPKIMALRS